jgi:hypothetical protein
VSEKPHAPGFFGLFHGPEDVLREFGGHHWTNDGQYAPVPIDPGGEILAAYYSYEDYSGDAAVIVRGRDGVLREVYGSHCSCYGLEDQWKPEEVVPSELLARAERRFAEEPSDWRDEADARAFYAYVASLIRGRA